MTVVTSDAFVQIVIKAEFLYILISPPISFGFTRHYSHHVISLGLAWPLRGFCPDLDGATVLYAALEALTLQKQALKTARTMSSKEPKQHSRIPVALQMIFLHSNRGFNVDQPPPERVASRVFPRRFFTKKQSSNASKPPLPKEVYVSKVPSSPDDEETVDQNYCRAPTPLPQNHFVHKPSRTRSMPMYTSPSCRPVVATVNQLAADLSMRHSSHLPTKQPMAASSCHQKNGRQLSDVDERYEETETEYGRGDDDDDGDEVNDMDTTNYDSFSDVLFETYEAEMEELIKIMDHRMQSTRRLCV